MRNIFRPELVITTKRKSDEDILKSIKSKLDKFHIDKIVVDTKQLQSSISRIVNIEIALASDLEKYVITNGVTNHWLFVISNPDNYLWM